MINKNNILHVKTYAFAVRIVNAFKFITQNKKEFILSKQLLRSGTSIGALVKESVLQKVEKILSINVPFL